MNSYGLTRHHHARNVTPGVIATDFSGMVRDNPELNKRVADMTALGRAGSARRRRLHDRVAAFRGQSLDQRIEVSRESPFKPILVRCLSCRCQGKCQGMDSERLGKMSQIKGL
jgi:hypothetical protein